jgi:hypothetical protein
MSTAVCTVMCNEPATRAPASGLRASYSCRIAIRPGISCSASRIWVRPASARDRSATANSTPLRLDTVLRMSLLGDRDGRSRRYATWEKAITRADARWMVKNRSTCWRRPRSIRSRACDHVRRSSRLRPRQNDAEPIITGTTCGQLTVAAEWPFGGTRAHHPIQHVQR